MRWLARILLGLGVLFCLSAFLPADVGSFQWMWPFGLGTASSFGASRLVFLTLAGIGGAGFGLAFAGLARDHQPRRSWLALLIVTLAASTALSLISNPGPAVLPLVINVLLVWGLVRGHWTSSGGHRSVLPDATRAVHPLLRVPVPWVFVLGYLAGLGLQRFVAAPQPLPAVRTSLWFAGLALIVPGAALAAWSLSLFHRAGTTTVPLEAPSTVVMRGPYRFSRNPMYVSLALIYLGECAIFAQLWPLVMLLPTLLYVNAVVVPFEEAQLRAAFGDRYRDYCTIVRRWL
jgi:protein-S-isoprenylcysteine O-methyltransferase Ste14